MLSVTRSVADYLASIKALLPNGLIWTVEKGSVFERLLTVFAESGQRVDARANQLLIDAFPSTSVELLLDWEATLGLPDACVGVLPTITQRQQQVVARLVASGGQSRAYFIMIAAALGLTILDIVEYRPMTAGMTVGKPIYGQAWAHAWRVEVLGNPANKTALECLIRRFAPAHTTVSFAYLSVLATSSGSVILDTLGNSVQTSQ